MVALGLNGDVVATGRTFSLEGTPNVENFELMVPESAFRPGRTAPGLRDRARHGRPALRPL